MPDYVRLTGLSDAAPNAVSKDVRFVLSTSEQPLRCVARYGVAAQIAAGLGTALRLIRMALASQGAIEPIAAEEVREIHIAKDLLSESVLIELTTTQGIPYAFQIHSQAAIEISDLLKNEATKNRPVGLA